MTSHNSSFPILSFCCDGSRRQPSLSHSSVLTFTLICRHGFIVRMCEDNSVHNGCCCRGFWGLRSCKRFHKWLVLVARQFSGKDIFSVSQAGYLFFWLAQNCFFCFSAQGIFFSCQLYYFCLATILLPFIFVFLEPHTQTLFRRCIHWFLKFDCMWRPAKVNIGRDYIMNLCVCVCLCLTSSSTRQVTSL